MTIVLPSLGKSLQKGLDQGYVDINPSFKTGRGSLPLFLGGFFCRVFDRSSGALLDDPSISAISAIRQLTLTFGKISLPCSPVREKKAMDEYVKCEQDVRQLDTEFTDEDLFEFSRMSSLLFRDLFTRMDRDIYYGEILPKHGPGSVADGLTSNGKYRNKTWTSRLARIFNPDEYLIPNHHFLDEMDQVNILEPDAEIPVKVISVPKTLKTPRIIAIEPTCMQYTQQAILRSFLVALDRDELLRGMIGIDDQTPNQRMACQGSIDGKTATLDLSEASDRVSNQLVRSMTSPWPYLQEALDATRSRRAEVPGHGVIRLSKFASMGSALCFPVEAMVFLTMIFLGIERSLNVTLSRKDIQSLSGLVRVYGDDLVVPVEHVAMIVQTLQHFGAKVGLDKSFWTGKFRESCGKEYFNGADVSLVRVRQVLPSTITDATSVISTVSLRNQLYNAGYWGTAEWLDNHLTKILKYFPIVGPDSPVLGRVSHDRHFMAERVHPDLHSPLVRGYVVQAKAPADRLEDSGALLKCLLKLESRDFLKGDGRYSIIDPCLGTGTLHSSSNTNEASSWSPTMSQDEKHLERSGRPKRVGIKLGWWTAL
jgi:hypothetical protein